MDLYKLRTFRTVALLLNFNKAAHHLNYAQSTVSVQIKSLEEEVGTLLFRRIKKRVALTPAGEKLLGYANRLLSIEDEAIADLKGAKDPKGTISLMVPEAMASCYFPDILERFLTRYPTIHFDISNCSDSCLEHDLQTGSVDIAFVFSDHIHSPTLVSEVMIQTNLLLVSAPNHALTDKPFIKANDLQSETVFFPKTGCGYGLPLKQMLNIPMIKPSSFIEFTSIQAIKKCVKKGMGLSILPAETVQKEIQNNELIYLTGMNPIEATLLMVWHKDKKISPILQSFMNICRQLPSRGEPINIPKDHM